LIIEDQAEPNCTDINPPEEIPETELSPIAAL
jgi:hypothetical protein